MRTKWYTLVLIALLTISNGFAVPLHIDIEHGGEAHEHALEHRHAHTAEVAHLEAYGCCVYGPAHVDKATENQCECCSEEKLPGHSIDDHQVIVSRSRTDAQTFLTAAITTHDIEFYESSAVKCVSITSPLTSDEARTYVHRRGPPVA